MLDLILEIQKKRPGWRFSLLGGDVQYAYKRNKKERIIGINRKKKEFFGWKAEFFGGIDPSKNTGDRHVSTGYYKDPHDAILMACTMAKKAIKEGAPK